MKIYGTKTWDKTIMDRSGDLREWVEAYRNFLACKIRIFAFANNHFAGHAPDTLCLFQDLMDEK